MFVEEKTGRSTEPQRDAPAGLALCHISNDPCQTGGQQQNPGPTTRKRGGRRGAKIENPCVGGSIPPPATKNIVHATPTHASGRCLFRRSQSLCPVYFRCQEDARLQGQGCPLIVRSSVVHAISHATQLLSGPEPYSLCAPVLPEPIARVPTSSRRLRPCRNARLIPYTGTHLSPGKMGIPDRPRALFRLRE